jgi:5-methylcytosine-specific restriction protein A
MEDRSMKRKPLSRLARVRLFDANEGICCLCGLWITHKKWVVEHIKPLWLGGADDETNMGPAHEQCAVAKTASEAPVKARTDRQRANHLGIRKPRTIRAWRRFNGERVFAERER